MSYKQQQTKLFQKIQQHMRVPLMVEWKFKEKCLAAMEIAGLCENAIGLPCFETLIVNFPSIFDQATNVMMWDTCLRFFQKNGWLPETYHLGTLMAFLRKNASC